MTEIVNLRQARKRAERMRKEAEAAANRAKHGMTKAERAQIEAEETRANRTLDQVKREDETEA
jgi:hypothetical protein